MPCYASQTHTQAHQPTVCSCLTVIEPIPAAARGATRYEEEVYEYVVYVVYSYMVYE